MLKDQLHERSETWLSPAVACRGLGAEGVSPIGTFEERPRRGWFEGRVGSRRKLVPGWGLVLVFPDEGAGHGFKIRPSPVAVD